MTVRVLSAKPGDGETVWQLAREFAEDHGDLDHFSASPQDFEAALFGPNAVCRCEIAMAGSEPAGHAFWHRSFSTFRGKPSIYLEDIYVRKAHRRMGVARALFKQLAIIAKRDGYASVYWLMMEWNEAARSFYNSIGAELESGVSFCRLHSDALQRLMAEQ